MVDPKIDFLAKQIRRALEIFAQQIEPESTMMEIADIYPVYVVKKEYKIGNIFSYGVNADGETQLYRVLQDHVSAEQWKPDEATSLYKKIGFTPSGYPIWTQPIGSTDAYMKNDIVQHVGKLWISTCDYNVWEPGIYGWAQVDE